MRERLRQVIDKWSDAWSEEVDKIIVLCNLSRERADGIMRAVIGLLVASVVGVILFVAVLLIWHQASAWLLMPAVIVAVDYALIRALSESGDDDDDGSGYA